MSKWKLWVRKQQGEDRDCQPSLQALFSTLNCSRIEGWLPSALPRVPQSPSYSFYFRPNERPWSAFGRSMCSVLGTSSCSTGLPPLALGAEPEPLCSSQSCLQGWALPEGKGRWFPT